MRRSASEIINELEMRIARLEKSGSIRDDMAKIQAVYDAGILDRSDYEKYMKRFEDSLSDPSVPKVGDILCSSWGSVYHPFVDFYEVIEVSSSGKAITLQRLMEKVVQGVAGDEGYVMPTSNEDWRERPIKNRSVSPSKNGYSVKISQKANAHKWDGKKKYFKRLN